MQGMRLMGTGQFRFIPASAYPCDDAVERRSIFSFYRASEPKSGDRFLEETLQKRLAMAVEDSVAQDQLRAFIERIERMEEEKAAIAADIKEIYAEAKGNGFDTKILRKIVTIRKQDANERMEQEALLELYMSALGMVEAPPER